MTLCTHMHTCTHTHTYTCTHTHAHAHAHAHTRAHTDTHTHAHTHARTCTHTHSISHSYSTHHSFPHPIITPSHVTSSFSHLHTSHPLTPTHSPIHHIVPVNDISRQSEVVNANEVHIACVISYIQPLRPIRPRHGSGAGVE